MNSARLLSSRRNRLSFFVVGLLSAALTSIGSAFAWADSTDITLDFVRHAQSVDNAAGIIDTVPPGTGLTPEGVTQATTIADQLAQGGPYAGLFSSDELRAIETAGYISDALHNMN